jgi:23S rRNA pseudouridine1911/1915/1917 synthase
MSTEPQRMIVPEGVFRQRADKILAAHFPDHSRTALQRAFDAGLVRVGTRALDRNDPVSAGDAIEFAMPDVVASKVRAVEIPLNILFEDEHMLAIDKPAGMVVHPGAGTREDTLVHALLSHCAGSLSGIGGVERPGIVHRLDRETSGVILVAKSDAAHRALAAAFASRDVVKEYLALVAGVPRLASGSIKKAIARHQTKRHKMTVVPEGGRPSHTDWRIEKSWPPHAALLRCRIHTGRTHQVRVHLSSEKHALLGDPIYGFKPAQFPFAVPRVMLHAARIAITHPVTGVALEIRAPLPKDFNAAMAALTALPAPRR